MSNLPVDRDKNYMKEMWGTTKLVTDYGYESKITNLEAKPFISEGSHFSHGHGFFTSRVQKQGKIHENIRNDDDYDDWEYGTEPIYGSKW
jgi:hypothetical protein